MQKAINKEKEQAGNRTVTVVNSGKRVFRDSFDGDPFELRPGYKASVPAKVAWTWFGDPEFRPDPDNPSAKGHVAQWNRELSRLESRHGWVGGTSPYPEERDKLDKQRKESLWKYILDGNLYIKEFGRGETWYRRVALKQRSTVIGVPLDGTEEVGDEQTKVTDEDEIPNPKLPEKVKGSGK